MKKKIVMLITVTAALSLFATKKPNESESMLFNEGKVESVIFHTTLKRNFEPNSCIIADVESASASMAENLASMWTHILATAPESAAELAANIIAFAAEGASSSSASDSNSYNAAKL